MQLFREMVSPGHCAVLHNPWLIISSNLRHDPSCTLLTHLCVISLVEVKRGVLQRDVPDVVMAGTDVISSSGPWQGWVSGTCWVSDKLASSNLGSIIVFY